MTLAVVLDIINLRSGITKSLKRLVHRLVDNFEIAAARKLLELDNGELRLNTGSITIHHQTNRTGRSNNTHLRIAESMLFTLLQRLIPHLSSRLEQFTRAILRINPARLDRQAFVLFFRQIPRSATMVADNAQHLLAVCLIAAEGTEIMGHLRRGHISLTSHQGRDCTRQSQRPG